jgi:hypothetical protein
MTEAGRKVLERSERTLSRRLQYFSERSEACASLQYLQRSAGEASTKLPYPCVSLAAKKPLQRAALFSRRDFKTLFTSRSAQPLIQRHERLIVRLFFAPDEGGGELQGIRGSEGMAGEQACRAAADVVGRRDRVGVLDERAEAISHLAQLRRGERRVAVAAVERRLTLERPTT